MYQYIDVNQIIDTKFCEDQSEVVIEFPVYSNIESEIKHGSRQKIKSSTSIFNIPKTHFVSFKGIQTNIGISTKFGIVHPDFFGVLHIDVFNSGLQNHILPYNLKLGTLSIKQYSAFNGVLHSSS